MKGLHTGMASRKGESWSRHHVRNMAQCWVALRIYDACTDGRAVHTSWIGISNGDGVDGISTVDRIWFTWSSLFRNGLTNSLRMMIGVWNTDSFFHRSKLIVATCFPMSQWSLARIIVLVLGSSLYLIDPPKDVRIWKGGRRNMLATIICLVYGLPMMVPFAASLRSPYTYFPIS